MGFFVLISVRLGFSLLDPFSACLLRKLSPGLVSCLQAAAPNVRRYDMRAEEVQIHTSISIIRAADDFGITKESRQDKIHEVTQLAAQFPPGCMGNLRKHDIAKAMQELTVGLIDKARTAGILRGGE